MTEEKILDLGKVADPLGELETLLEAEESTPEQEYIFTAEEGSILRNIILESKPIYCSFLGKPHTPELEREIGIATFWVTKRAQVALKRKDFHFVAIPDGNGYRMDVVIDK